MGGVAGIAYITARRQYAAGKLPVPPYRLGRLIVVGEPLPVARAVVGQVVVYARVSSADQRRRRAAADRARRAIDAATGEDGTA
ncbi:hypothetical protein ONA91_16520 [Micromonospora sp. DR5-3]|uniref:hypothetical protein n=1 Tax=unclassified Micromonospora TaxID=2617518 RepID=UPI0011D80071|nr:MULTISPECIES: hypothetical protein [unclassified Micromonospora]MCW3816047.1 hypothetical protein [Micromonospora sp. DR5-3]TYC21276.1 hypothetical protein FXF52_26765 [Micromonospora sp. MP36]